MQGFNENDKMGDLRLILSGNTDQNNYRKSTFVGGVCKQDFMTNKY